MTYVYLSNGQGIHVDESINDVMQERERAEAGAACKWGRHGRNDRWMRLTPRGSEGQRMLVLAPMDFVGCDGELR